MISPILPFLHSVEERDANLRQLGEGSGNQHHGGSGERGSVSNDLPNSDRIFADKWEASAAILDQMAPPTLAMNDESFVCSTMANFDWTALYNNQVQKANRITSSALFSTQFTLRHFKVVKAPSLPCDFPPIGGDKKLQVPQVPLDTRRACNLAEVFLSRAIQLEAQNRSDHSELSVRPLLKCPYVVEVDPNPSSPVTVGSNAPKSPCLKTRNSPSQPASRAGGSATKGSNGVRQRSPSSESHKDSGPMGGNAVQHRKVPAAKLIPATYSRKEDPNRINIRVQGATPGDLNELRWLLASINHLEGASVFTQLVESRDVKHFHIVTEGPTRTATSPRCGSTGSDHGRPLAPGSPRLHADGSCDGSNKSYQVSTPEGSAGSSTNGPMRDSLQPHCFKLMHPWHTCWKWLGCLLECEATSLSEVSAAYFAAVGLTWAPLPEMIEASWIYEIQVYGQCRESSLLPEGQRKIIASSKLTKEELVVDSLQKGFEGFLLDVVAFWRGMSESPEHTNRLSTTANDLAAVAALGLKQRASRRCGNLWMLGEASHAPLFSQVPIGALVKGCWEAVKWRRSWWPCVLSDMTIIIPSKLSTVDFMFKADGLNSTQAQEHMFVNGYNFNPGDDLDRFKLGVSTAGLILGCNFFLLDIMDRNARQQNSWLFDVDRGFILGGSNLNILFMACQGTNIRANYDEGFAKMIFVGPYPFGAVAEWPRSCYFSADSRRQHQVIFNIENPLDKRGFGVLDMLNGLRRYGGLLHLQCTSVRHALASSGSMDSLIPQLPRFQAGLSIHPRSQSLGQSRHRPLLAPVIGYIHSDTITPGRYTVGSLPTVQHPMDATKVRFCKIILHRDDEVEVYGSDRHSLRVAPEIETEPISFADGISVSAIDLKLVSPSGAGEQGQ